jgi:autophagy-related protein 5
MLAATEDELHLSRKLWKGDLSISFTLDAADNVTSSLCDSVYILACRMGYLPVVAADVVSHFQEYAIESAVGGTQQVWFSHNNKPLKAHLPIGVIYDSLCVNDNDSGMLAESHDTVFVDLEGVPAHTVPPKLLPLEVKIHFQNFPELELLPCSTPVHARALYAHSLKQALYLLHGSTKAYNNMTPIQQAVLFDAANEGRRASYEEVAREIRAAGEESSRSLRYPIRLVSNTRVRQVPQEISASADANLGSILGRVAGVFCSVLVQGIEVPLDIPMHKAWRLFHSADLYLYITLVEPHRIK